MDNHQLAVESDRLFRALVVRFQCCMRNGGDTARTLRILQRAQRRYDRRIDAYNRSLQPPLSE